MRTIVAKGIGMLTSLVIISILLVGALGCAEPAPPISAVPVTTTAPTPEPKTGIVLKYAHALPATHLINKSIEVAFKEPLEALTNGRIKVTIYPGGVLGKQEEFYELVQSGTADIVHGNPNHVAGRWPINTIFSLPFLFPNSSVAYLAIRDFYMAEKAFFDNDFPDVIIGGFFATTPNGIILKQKVTTLEEMKGLRIRVVGEAEARAAALLGFTPVSVSGGELYFALDKGVLDGIQFPISSVPSYGFHEVAKYQLDVGMSVSAMSHYMNKDSFANLPDEYKPLVMKLLGDVFLNISFNYDVTEVNAKKFLASKGVEVYTLSSEERARWEKQVQPVYDNWVTDLEQKGLPARRMLAALLKSLEKTQKL